MRNLFIIRAHRVYVEEIIRSRCCLPNLERGKNPKKFKRRQLASTPLATDLGVVVCRPGSLDIQRSIEIEKETR